MHIFFSGIGGAGIGPLAILAKQAGYDVSGSDKQDSQYIAYLASKGITNVHVGQTTDAITKIHASHPIDWFVYSGALPRENPNHPELVFCTENKIKSSKRDELLTKIIADQNLKLIAVAGTHGKTTTTAMIVWLFKCLGLPLTYSVGAKTTFSDSGHFEGPNTFFAYECDEFDRNFLAFHPFLSAITGITWDHHDIYPTKDSYKQAFVEFIGQSRWTLAWKEDIDYITLAPNDHIFSPDTNHPLFSQINLLGKVNRYNAWLALWAVHEATSTPIEELVPHMNQFPGLSRRFEKIRENLFSDYAHNAEKVRGAIDMALESSQNVVVIYEGLHNRRQHFMREQGQFTHLFDGAKHVYWLPSYLGREDPDLALLSPSELITSMADSTSASAAEANEALRLKIDEHIHSGDLVICMSGGGGNSLDEWLRKQYPPETV